MEYETRQMHKVFSRFINLRYRSKHSIRDVIEWVDVEMEQRASDSDVFNTGCLSSPGLLSIALRISY